MIKSYKKISDIVSTNYVTKAFSYYSLAQVISAISSFGILSLYTKHLEPAMFGKISLMWVVVIVVSILIDGRLNTAFYIKYYKSSKEENTTNIYSIFVYNFIVLGIFYFVFLSFPSLIENILGTQILKSELTVIFLLLLFMIFGNFYKTILMVSQKPKSYFFMMLIFNTALIISSFIYLVILKAGYISYLKAYVISYMILSFFGLRFIIITYKPRKKNISFSKLKKLLYISLPLIPDALLLMLLIWADRYVLNIYKGLTIVGIYSAGYRFSDIINAFVVTPFGQALSPILFEQFTQSIDEYKRTMGQVLKYYWLVILGITIAYFVVLKETYKLSIGAEYMQGYNIIGIVLFGIVFGGAGSLLGATMIIKEKTAYSFVFTSISVFLNIGLNFILVPKYGMYGAAVATLVSYILQFIMILYYTQKLLFISYDYRFMLKSTVLSLFFLGAVMFISYLSFNSLILLGLKTILFLLFVLATYNIKDLRYLWKRFLKNVSE